MKPLTPEELRQAVARRFPAAATDWSQATDEVRDLCRGARLLAGVPEDEAVDFRKLETPDQWNTQGIAGIVRFYGVLPHQKQAQFCVELASLWGG